MVAFFLLTITCNSFAFDFSSGANKPINALALQPDGSVLIGGLFTEVGGRARSHVARLIASGIVDPAFNPSDLGFSPNISNLTQIGVLAIAVQADSKVLIAGTFIKVGEFSRSRVARLNADGSLDQTFNPGTIDNRFAGTTDDTSVTALAVQPDGKVLIAGEFTDVGPLSRGYVARLNADGSVDQTFNALGQGADAPVRAIVLQPDGKVLIGGNFVEVNDSFRRSIARLNADGSVDPTFDPDSVGNIFSLSGINALALQPDGKVLIGGEFIEVGGLSRSHIARLNADGSVDQTFNPGSGADDIVFALGLRPDGKVLIGGSFTEVGGIAITGIAQLNADGSVDQAFNPRGPIGGRGGRFVFAIAVQPNGSVVVAGSFSEVSGFFRRRIARLDTDGSISDNSLCLPIKAINGNIASICL